MLNQFHDIIPGTSIPEAYVTSTEEYTKVFALGTSAMESALGTLVERIATDSLDGLPYVIFNSLGWERGEVVTITGDVSLTGLAAFDHQGNHLAGDLEQNGDVLTLSVYVPSIPAFGYTTIWLRQAPDADVSVWKQEESFPSVWETDFYTLEFNDVGEITRWYDKSIQREWLKPGDKANELQFFHDKPTYWDAWDIDPRFESQRAGAVQLISGQIVQRGATRDVLRFHWKLNNSEIHQDMILYRHQRRVDFKTKVNWVENHKLLKVAFPVDLVSAKATYEIPFGALERPTHNNTSWEQAQFEVCGHRWADVSEGNSGVSLLNDCKYGYDIKDQTIRLSLLRAPKWPDEHADQGEHEFTYSLLPHQGDWREAGVVRRATELNHPAQVVAAGRHSGILTAEHSWIHFRSEHVILDTVKASEDGTGTVLRFYESSGGRETVEIQWSDARIQTSVVNLLEDEIRPLACREGTFELTFKPYEIQSVKIGLPE
jgi:alpha-mannosidase